MREELWDDKHLFAGLPTGVRVARMVVKKNIASYVTIDSEMTHLVYYGQQQTCRYCSEFVHNGVSCVQNKKLLVQKLAANSISYADVTKNPQVNRPKPLQSGRQQGTNPLSTPSTNGQSQKPTLSNIVPPSTGSMPPTAGSMPPPANVVDLTTAANGQQGDGEGEPWTKVTRSRGHQKNTDGNETDSSTSSRHSHKHKKAKTTDHNSHTSQ